jgi:lysine-ketoglutarate reductase/saccharopine dehydrogenase-like protein (TIGR00300 family)
MPAQFDLPAYRPPDFSDGRFAACPVARTVKAEADGIIPDGYHATSIYPEYIQTSKGVWKLLSATRMDCAVVVSGDSLEVREFRRVRKDEAVLVGRSEDGEEGIYVHTTGFVEGAARGEKFSFHIRRTRETPFSRDYDSMYELLRHERDNGKIVWVLGPALTFDFDSRSAMSGIIDSGYAHAVLAGNALATHDIEAALYRTGLGQDIYTKEYRRLGHYHHLDAINTVRRHGSMKSLFEQGLLEDGIVRSCLKRDIPLVLAGSIRDDGPLPEVIADVYRAQDAMRATVRDATTVIALATQLHAIATGNMLPSYQVFGEVVRPVYFYIVDVSEFALDKLANRGSLEVRGIVTNVQDFLINLQRALA